MHLPRFRLPPRATVLASLIVLGAATTAIFLGFAMYLGPRPQRGCAGLDDGALWATLMETLFVVLVLTTISAPVVGADGVERTMEMHRARYFGCAGTAFVCAVASAVLAGVMCDDRGWLLRVFLRWVVGVCTLAAAVQLVNGLGEPGLALGEG
jgi:hypothetical protein